MLVQMSQIKIVFGRAISVKSTQVSRKPHHPVDQFTIILWLVHFVPLYLKLDVNWFFYLGMSGGYQGNYECTDVTDSDLFTLQCTQPGLNELGCVLILTTN